jgi:hypothetical protein
MASNEKLQQNRLNITWAKLSNISQAQLRSSEVASSLLRKAIVSYTYALEASHASTRVHQAVDREAPAGTLVGTE